MDQTEIPSAELGSSIPTNQASAQQYAVPATIQAVHYPWNVGSEAIVGKCVYDVATSDGQILYHLEAFGASRSLRAQYRKGDTVLVLPLKQGRWCIVGHQTIGNEAPTLSGEERQIDPDGRSFVVHNAAGHQYRQTRGVSDCVVADELPLHEEDFAQQADISAARRIDSLPQTLYPLLLNVLGAALEPIVAQGVSTGLSATSIRLSGLESLGVMAQTGVARLYDTARRSESGRNAVLLTNQIMKSISLVVSSYRMLIALRDVHTTLPTAQELQEQISDQLRSEFRTILKSLFMSAFTGSKPVYRRQIELAIIAAETILLDATLQTVASALLA